MTSLTVAVRMDPTDVLARLALADYYEEHGKDDDATRQRSIAAVLSRERLLPNDEGMRLCKGARRCLDGPRRVRISTAVVWTPSLDFTQALFDELHSYPFADFTAESGRWQRAMPSRLSIRIEPGNAIALVESGRTLVLVHPDDVLRYGI